MAKEKDKGTGLSWDDFQENDDNLLDSTEDEVENDEIEEEEVEEEEEKPKAKKVIKKAKEVEKEETEDTEEENSEDQEPKPTPKLEKKKEVVEEEKEETPEPTDEEQEEANEAEFANNFMGKLEELTGNEVDVDYGDISPISVEGLALREKAVKEHVLTNFLQEIEENFPKIYKALEYANNGGDPADLFRQATSRDYSKVNLTEGDAALAKEILREYYAGKKLSEAKIAKNLEQDEDSEIGIVGEAKVVLAELQKEQEERSQELLRGQEQKALEEKKRTQVFLSKVEEVLESRTLGNFKIGDKVEANEFKKFVIKNLQKAGDSYVLLTPVDTTNLPDVLKYEYFKFKKGDLSKIIQRQAATENANKLKLRMKGESQQKQKGGATVGTKGNTLTLRDFEG